MKTRSHRGVRILLLTALIGALVVGLPERFGTRANPVETLRAATASYRCPASSSHIDGEPCRIRIRSIGVLAMVINLGLNPDGTLEVPTNFRETGWWSGGTKPGETGPTVIVGHIDSTAGPAVFYRLKQLKPGAIVKIWRANMEPVKYRLTRMIEVPKSNFPTQDVYGSISYPGIRLITCGGSFDHSTGHYVDNVIWFGRIVS